MEKLLHCRGGERVKGDMCERCGGTGKKIIKLSSIKITMQCDACKGSGYIFPKS